MHHDQHTGGDDDDGTCAIPSVALLAVALVFLLSPGFALYLASGSVQHPPTALERFLLAQLGIYFVVVAASLVLRTARHPLLVPLTLGSSLSAFLSYNSATAVASLGSLLFLSQLVVSLWGFYSLLFGNEPAHRSKTTGADKRTSSFIFGNKAAASSRKKEWTKKMKGDE